MGFHRSQQPALVLQSPDPIRSDPRRARTSRTWQPRTPTPPPPPLVVCLPPRLVHLLHPDPATNPAIRRARSATDGVPGHLRHLLPRRLHRLPLLAPLLQPRRLHQHIPFDSGYYRYSLLLDDVGNRVPRPDEAFDQPHPERRVSPALPRRQLKFHC
uniref:Uncharacterized protein n=1 Tax=Aegilops tauschii subsp. strangulata TaxID=200361 RepID=A0A453QHZ5_AEGTS